MKKIVPVAGVPISFVDLFKSITSKNTIEQFAEQIKQLFGVKHCFFVNSGTTAFYIILQTLKKLYPSRNEVIIPACTAVSMGTALKKSGVIVKLIDISLDDFMMSMSAVGSNVSPNTLCIVPTHMFGIPCDIHRLKKIVGTEMPPVIVEDFAQAAGSKIEYQKSNIKNQNESAGTFGDIGFFSLARGKNFTTYTGGCLITNNHLIASEIKKEIDSLPQQSFRNTISTGLKIFILSQAVKPIFYGLLYPLLSKFKNIPVPEDFVSTQYSNLQARFGSTIFNHFESFSEKRFQNGIRLIKELSSVSGIVLPRINEKSRPAFNRLPLLFKDLTFREKIEIKLLANGIETSQFHLYPLHHIFDFGYKKEEFPNTVYLSEHLLTLPVHPLVTEKDLKTIVEAFKQ